MSDGETDWDGIAKFRWTDTDNGEAQFDASDEIHDDLRELIKEWRESNGQGGPWFRHCADDLEELLNDE